MRADTIPARLMSQAELRPNDPAYYVKQRGQWRVTDWGTYVGEVRQAARSLISLGLSPGQKIAILGGNRPEWSIFCLGAMSAGGVAIGVYTTSSAEEIQYVLHHAEAAVVLIDTAAQWDKIAAQREQLPLLKHVVLMKDAPAVEHPMVLRWEQFLDRGRSVSEHDLDERISAIQPDGVAILIYTSGTTGPPKGVMLTHSNLAWTASVLAGLIGARAEDYVLSYLPLSHIAEQMMSVHVPTGTGYYVYYVEALDKVADNFREVQPTIVFGVPRIWEKFYGAVSARLSQVSGAQKALVSWVQHVASQVTLRRNRGEPLGTLLSLQYKLASYLFFDKLKTALGLKNARFCVSGAAPIGKEILEFFASLDIVIREVYGQSEACGPTSLNTMGNTKLGTVGKPIPGVEVKVAPDGEILVKGLNVFPGYYKDDKATADALRDGWLYSGDLGEIDSEGFLRITGRKKDIIITAGGKNIAPQNIESALKNSGLISEAVVIGDRRKYLTALITLDEQHAQKFFAERALPAAPVDKSPELHQAVQAIIDEVNSHLAQVETIKKFTIIPTAFTIEKGELTPTLKIKRNIVSERYAPIIDAMYEGKEPSSS